MFEPIVYLTKGSEGWLLTILFCRLNCEHFVKCFLREERIQDEVVLCSFEDNDRVIFLSSVRNIWGFFMAVVYVTYTPAAKLRKSLNHLQPC